MRPFPDSGGKWQVWTGGSVFPQWRGDGKELFYVCGDGKLMAVEVKGGATFEAGTPTVLFDFGTKAIARSGYAVTADGQRFLFVRQTQASAAAPFAVVLNWTAETKR